jgi:hypothetical protein
MRRKRDTFFNTITDHVRIDSDIRMNVQRESLFVFRNLR